MKEFELPSAILVVDDSKDACVMIKSMLQTICPDVEYVLTATDAVRILEENSYDVVIMDLDMPETDGFTAVRELRRQGIKRPIIALSGHDDQESRSRAMESGFNGFLAKPIRREKLCETVLTAYKESR